MRYEKATAEVVLFENDEFMTASGQWEGNVCINYNGCGRVTDDSMIICWDFYHCNNFECARFRGYGYLDGFYCLRF